METISNYLQDVKREERVGELNLKINHFNIDELCIPERTLVRIEK